MFGDQSMLRIRCCLPRAIPEEFLDYPAEGGCSHQGASAITFSVRYVSLCQVAK